MRCCGAGGSSRAEPSEAARRPTGGIQGDASLDTMDRVSKPGVTMRGWKISACPSEGKRTAESAGRAQRRVNDDVNERDLHGVAYQGDVGKFGIELGHVSAGFLPLRPSSAQEWVGAQRLSKARWIGS
jgi:hypothetical protein